MTSFWPEFSPAIGSSPERLHLIYLPSRHWDNKLHLLVVNRKATSTVVADVAVEPLGRGEEIIPDGIAITNDMVYLVTNEGRILAFKSK